VPIGALGGVVGTILYDVVRIPFVIGGYRLFAPISSYGLLMINAPHSSPLTEFLGWTYNFENGIGFGAAYGILAPGRPWWWAVPFALALETTTVVTPYADVYGLRGHYDIIAIAYGAHIFYAIGLGGLVQWAGSSGSAHAFLVPWAVAALVAALLVWQHPWTPPAYLASVGSVARDEVVIVDNRFEPEWTYLGPTRCLTVVNRDTSQHQIAAANTTILPQSSLRFCLAGPGVKRIQLDNIPYSGGFVIIDPPSP
jgi:hypothetical protein